MQYFFLTDDAVIQRGHIIEKVEALKHHPHFRAVGGYGKTFLRNIFAVINDLTRSRRFQQVNAAEQRGFTGPRRTDDAGDIAGRNGKINIF